MADMPKADKDERKNLRARFEALLADSREPTLKAAAWAGHRAFRLTGEMLSVLIALGIALLFFVSGLATRQSADLSALRVNFQTWFSQSFEGARAELGDLELRWNPADETVTFTVTDVIVYDEEDRVVQTLPRLRATTRQSDLLDRRAALRDIEIVGGVVTWLRDESGSVRAGLGSPETIGGVGPVYRGGSSDDSALDLSWLQDFSTLTLRDSRAHIVDRRDGLNVALDIDALQGIRERDRIRLDIEGRVVGSGDGPLDNSIGNAGAIQLSLRSDDALETIDLELELAAFRPDRVAPSSGRWQPFETVALPVDAGFAALYSRDSGLLSANLNLTAMPGTVRIAGDTRQVEEAEFVGELRPGDEVMTVETIRLQSDRLDLTGRGVMRDLGRLYDGDVGTSPQFDLQFVDARLDITPFLAAPVDFGKLNAIGALDLDTRTLSLEQVEAAFERTAVDFSATVVTHESGLAALALSGRSTETMSATDLLSVWPVKAADGARRWIDRSVLDGTLHNLRFDIDLDEEFFAEPRLEPDALQVEFDVRDGVVRYISTMDVLSEAFGSGRIDGNRFGMVLDSGRIGDIEIVGGDVDIPRLTPKGGDILISAQARGEAQTLMRLINQPPFEYMDRYGVDPDGFSGQADITLNIKRPLLEYFDEERIEYAVEGRFKDAAAPFQLGEYRVSGGDVDVRGGKEGLFLTGQADIGPWRADLAWEERYGRNGEPTRYRISGPMDQKVLDGFGFGFRQLFGGTLQVEIEATGEGVNVSDALIDVGLQDAEVSFGEIWSKSIGEDGAMRIDLSRSDDGLSIRSFTAQAPGLDLAGEGQLRSDLSLDQARLDRAVIDGLIDGRIILSRDPDMPRLALDASGRLLDLSSFIGQALRSGGNGASDLPLSVDAAFNSIVLGQDYDLGEAALTYRHDGSGIERMSMRGSRPDGDFAMILSESGDDRSRKASIEIPDISAAASSLLGLTSTQGGSLRLEAEMPALGETGSILGNVWMQDFMVQDAPFLAQILSLASLTGMLDTLSGDGLAFDELMLDFGLQDRRLSVRDAKMRGPAIGMTGEGDIALDARTVDFSGTLVPAYTANSLLGDIPLIGDIFVGKDGEGVFAVTYSVTGPFSQAQIAINPLSALTPGFIRGIFRQSRDDLPESRLEEIEAVRPPSSED